LRTLASVVEPVKEYRRYQQRPQTMLSPLTGLVDAARPDSLEARRFNASVELLLSDAPRFESGARSLRATLSEWQAAGPELEALIDGSPALAEARPLASDLSRTGTIGLEALSYIEKGVEPGAEWRASRLAALEEIAKPKAALEFPALQSVRQLVFAASELPSLRQTTPADWKARVKALAAPTSKSRER
jgi:hexosaminidase